jgi:hypothetical protein
MHRRDFIKGVSVVAGTAATSSGNAFREDLQAGLILDLSRTITTIPSDFIGLGYESSSVARRGLLSATNSVYTQLCRTLGSSGVIRIGGNTSDYASYSASAQPLSSPETGPGSVVNDVVLRDLGSFLEATGWKLIWGLNLGRGTIEAAVEEAKAVAKATGPSLFAFEIGNEPDLFPHREIHRKKGYGYEDYLLEYRKFRDAVRKSIPGIPFAGPDVAIATSWVSRFARDEGRDLKLLTHHHYRDGQNPTSSIEKLLHTDPKLGPMLAELQSASQFCRVSYRICETNSFSGGGKHGVSDRFASALWVLDFMYKLAAAQCGNVSFPEWLCAALISAIPGKQRRCNFCWGNRQVGWDLACGWGRQNSSLRWKGVCSSSGRKCRGLDYETITLRAAHRRWPLEAAYRLELGRPAPWADKSSSLAAALPQPPSDG